MYVCLYTHVNVCAFTHTRASLYCRALLVAQTVENPPTVQETWHQNVGREDPMEEEMVTRSSTLAWGIPWTEAPGGLGSWGHKESDTTERLTLSLS